MPATTDAANDGESDDLASPDHPRDRTSARLLIEKLRNFIDGLDPSEREFMAALLGPGVELAYAQDDQDDDVSGFGVNDDWTPRLLPDYLAATIREHDLRITARGRE